MTEADDAVPTDLSVTAARTPSGTRLAVRGELDISTADQLLEAVREVCDDDGLASGSAVELDLRDLAFLDAVGLSALLRASSLAQSRGRRLHLSGVGPFTHRILALTRLAERLGVDPDQPPRA